MLTVPQYIFSNFHVQGPHKWYPLRGQMLKPRDPKPVDVFDKRGDQSGCNDWAALRRVEEELNERYWRDSPWVDHPCDQCRKCTPIEGQNFFKAAAIDGNTSTRYFKVRRFSFSAEKAGPNTATIFSHLRVDDVILPFCVLP